MSSNTNNEETFEQNQDLNQICQGINNAKDMISD
jgi:hypothetical protein